MCTREARGGGHLVDSDLLGVVAVGEVPGAEQVPGGRDRGHAREATFQGTVTPPYRSR